VVVLERARAAVRVGAVPAELVVDGALAAVSFLTVPFVTGGVP
jgi:hypothetical protein